ncbi:MAG: DUF1080 domain-containing protein [Candidatus Poribacteria bacterium]|nr:DUF1080 domain-containing protein [Candidatus Poribacteria bacterium]
MSWKPLFNGTDLTGWRLRQRKNSRPSRWVVQNGLLENTGSGVDLITEETFGDCALKLEYMMPANSNSGVYLRGRYEIQMLDSYGKTYNNPAMNGALYRVKAPDVEVTRPAWNWQTLDILMFKHELTVRLNGVLIHDRVPLTGPTGSNWLWNDNGLTGPHFLQGDHGPVKFRNMWAMRL